jgi:hypothetical protein
MERNGNNAERRARQQQRGQEVEMMDDRPISAEEREIYGEMDAGRKQPNGPAKAVLLAGGIGVAALGVATLLSRLGGRRRRRSLLRPSRWMRLLRKPRRGRLRF